MNTAGPSVTPALAAVQVTLQSWAGRASKWGAGHPDQGRSISAGWRLDAQAGMGSEGSNAPLTYGVFNAASY